MTVALPEGLPSQNPASSVLLEGACVPFFSVLVACQSSFSLPALRPLQKGLLWP